MPRKRSSSSDQTPTGSEVRRGQVRQAQRVYHARRKEAFHNLEERVRFLEQAVVDMSNVMIGLNDALVSSPVFRQQPDLVRQLENALRQTIESASTIHPSSNDTNAAPDPVVKAKASPSGQEVARAAQPLVPSNNQTPMLAGMAMRERRLISMANPAMPIHSTLNITLKHPLASLIFPFFDEWSGFGLRLYWSTLTLAYTSMADYQSSLGPEMFRYTLESRSRERILLGLRTLLDFKAATPARPDGSVVLIQRTQQPTYPSLGPGFDHAAPSGSQGDEHSPETLQRSLYKWMCSIEKLQADVRGAIECSPRDRDQEWLRANEIETYIQGRGVRVLGDSSTVEIPLSRDAGSGMPSLDMMGPIGAMDSLDPTWDELTMDMMNAGPDDLSGLYPYTGFDAGFDVDVDADAGSEDSTPSTTTTAATSASTSLPMASSSVGVPTASTYTPAPAPAYSVADSTFNPLSWQDPSSVFPFTVPQQRGHASAAAEMGPARPPLPQQQQQQQQQESDRCTINMDDLIRAISTLGVCVGGVARYPSRGIDATLDALAMGGRGRMVF